MSMNLQAESPEADRYTFYLRSDFRHQASNVVTMNWVHALNTRWGTLETAARVGEIGGDSGTWGYKIEGLSPRFRGNHRIAIRVVKNGYYLNSGTSGDTRIAERLLGAYRPFERMGLLSDFDVLADVGMAQIFMEDHGATLLPNGDGKLNLLPVWALKLKVPETGTKRAYLMTYSNFDVFDPYPASQPFLQAEVTQKVDDITYFSYVRYRWNYSIENFYSLYFAVGAEL